MNSRVQNLLITLTLVSMESSHLVIFSTSGKFITKFNFFSLHQLKWDTILDRGQGSNTNHLNSLVIAGGIWHLPEPAMSWTWSCTLGYSILLPIQGYGRKFSEFTFGLGNSKGNAKNFLCLTSLEVLP